MRDIFKQFDIELSDQQENKLKEYYKILVEENKKMNLTSITEYEDVVWKHFFRFRFNYERFFMEWKK
ncbi:MAG: hypothetical protein ACLTJ5_03010 [Clostridium sp.]